MENIDSELLNAQLALIWKKLDDLERKIDRKGSKIAPIKSYLKDLQEQASKILHQIR